MGLRPPRLRQRRRQLGRRARKIHSGHPSIQCPPRRPSASSTRQARQTQSCVFLAAGRQCCIEEAERWTDRQAAGGRGTGQAGGDDERGVDLEEECGRHEGRLYA